VKKIVVVDFGGQFAQLIATKIRKLGAFSEIVSEETDLEYFATSEVGGIILSGGPASVYATGAPTINKEIFNLGKPILGICYGHQLIAHLLGGEVSAAKTREFGKATFKLTAKSSLTQDLSPESIMWMSHGDEVTVMPPGFINIGSTLDGEMAAMANLEKNIYGIQFHPEVTHSEEGQRLLANFVKICQLQNTWQLTDFITAKIAEIHKQVGDKKVFLLVSGGVDSSVCFALLEHALGRKRVFGLFVDTGLLRHKEAIEVSTMLEKAGFDNLHVADEEERFLTALKNSHDPETKREIIGKVFLEVVQKTGENLKLNPDDWFLAQGTIFPDTIETGGSKNAAKIKTHHNRVAEIEELIAAGRLIEPLKDLFKDEVREVGRQIGLPAELVQRKPFPGPGLAVRILCPKAAEELQAAKKICKKLEKETGHQVVIPPLRSVGVQGDARSYAHAAVIFTGLEKFDFELLENLATKIPNQDEEINRVLACLSHQNVDPSAWQLKAPRELTAERVALLQEADKLVMETVESLASKEVLEQIWQFSVVLMPWGEADLESIILRPIASENAMTASVVDLRMSVYQQIAQRVKSQLPAISGVFFDLTNKPPATIEWE
jgi:GMP synthase (glutamine-hydrolysing)